MRPAARAEVGRVLHHDGVSLMRPDVARLARVRVVADHLIAMFEESSQGSACQ